MTSRCRWRLVLSSVWPCLWGAPQQASPPPLRGPEPRAILARTALNTARKRCRERCHRGLGPSLCRWLSPARSHSRRPPTRRLGATPRAPAHSTHEPGRGRLARSPSRGSESPHASIEQPVQSFTVRTSAELVVMASSMGHGVAWLSSCCSTAEGREVTRATGGVAGCWVGTIG